MTADPDNDLEPLVWADLDSVLHPANNEVKAGAAAMPLPTARRLASRKGQRQAPAYKDHPRPLSSVASPVGLRLPKRFGGRAGALPNASEGLNPCKRQAYPVRESRGASD
jgi:hypothetical protein